MTYTVLDALFDRAGLPCPSCGELSEADHSKCFVTLRCTECQAEKRDCRIPEYFDLDVIDTTCPDCGLKKEA